jgi:hypothetical protein
MSHCVVASEFEVLEKYRKKIVNFDATSLMEELMFYEKLLSELKLEYTFFPSRRNCILEQMRISRNKIKIILEEKLRRIREEGTKQRDLESMYYNSIFSINTLLEIFSRDFNTSLIKEINKINENESLENKEEMINEIAMERLVRYDAHGLIMLVSERTKNLIIENKEFKNALELVEFLYTNKLDAIIFGITPDVKYAIKAKETGETILVDQVPITMKSEQCKAPEQRFVIGKQTGKNGVIRLMKAFKYNPAGNIVYPLLYIEGKNSQQILNIRDEIVEYSYTFGCDFTSVAYQKNREKVK